MAYLTVPLVSSCWNWENYGKNRRWCQSPDFGPAEFSVGVRLPCKWTYV